MSDGRSILVSAKDVVSGAGSDGYTVVLLHMNGSDASTTFTDNAFGGLGHTWTANGNAQIDTAQSKFGGASGLFDGNGDYISTPDSDDFFFSAGDFTFDTWVRLSTDKTEHTLFKHNIDGTNFAIVALQN
jgi:hypothetical protein